MSKAKHRFLPQLQQPKDCTATSYVIVHIKHFHYSPKVKPSVLIRALLQITIDTEDTTDKLRAPMVPSWNFWLSPISTLLLSLAQFTVQKLYMDLAFPHATIFVKFQIPTQMTIHRATPN